jgi:hypothetical protein
MGSFTKILLKLDDNNGQFAGTSTPMQVTLGYQHKDTLPMEPCRETMDDIIQPDTPLIQTSSTPNN